MDETEETRTEVPLNLIFVAESADSSADEVFSPNEKESVETIELDAAQKTEENRSLVKRAKLAKVKTKKRGLCPRSEPTEEEKDRMARLKDLSGVSNGLKNEDNAWTTVMIMKEETSGLIHLAILDMILASGEKILKKLMTFSQFLPVLYDWLNLYSKTSDWNDVAEKVVDLLSILPMNKEDVQIFHLKVRKLSKDGLSDGLRSKALRLIEDWERKRTSTKATGPVNQQLARLNSWPTRKVGKALVAVSPEPKRLKHRSHSARSPRLYSPIKIDSLPPSAAKAINKLRLTRHVDDSMTSSPSSLIHSMDRPPSSPIFYAQQRTLYNEMRSEKHSDSKSTDKMVEALEWETPSPIECPSSDIVNIPLDSPEKAYQDHREKAVPVTASDRIFSSIFDDIPKRTSRPAFNIPFFPNNDDQYRRQREVMEGAGIVLASVLGPERKD